MLKNVWCGIGLLILSCLPLGAQTNTFCQSGGQPTVHAGKLVCMLPNLGFPPVTSGPDPIGGLDAAIASQAGLFPLASPASGIVYTTDPSLQITVPSGTESFGPVMFERGETLHRGKFFLAFTYQNFQFGNMDGVNLKDVPAYFLVSNTGPTYVETGSRIDLKINQFAVYATYGLTNRIDVSVAVPFLDVKLGATSTCESAAEVGVGTGTCQFTRSDGSKATTVTQSSGATGIGDIVLRAKGSLWQGERFRVAAAVDVRVPTGDELNFLGTGAVGVRPFLAASWRGRVAPHADFGFQWNGNSDIASIQGPGISGKLPNSLFYVAGADARVVKRLTLSADYLGQHVIDALRQAVQVQPDTGFKGVFTASGSFNTNYVSVGGKLNPVGNLLITANVFFKLDNNGLHNKPAPMVGLSYTF
ncbi:MAG TPA: transporter [Candidatus Dormibacteraeota bacterium]|nr:transporter [Candidatus Dormibacteraeota bacterium]